MWCLGPTRVSNFDRAFQAVQYAANHVEPHAPSGDFRNFFGGAESGRNTRSKISASLNAGNFFVADQALF